MKDLRLSLTYRLEREHFTALEAWPGADVQHSAVSSAHGPSRQITITFTQHILRFSLTFSLPLEQPVCLWQLCIENVGTSPICLDRIELLNLPRIALDEPAFFSNGWQSWSHSGVYGLQNRFHRTHLGALTTPLRVNAGTPQPKERGRFGSDMFGILGDRAARQAMLAGFLSQQQHFGSLEAVLSPAGGSLRLWANGDGARLDPGHSVATDWVCLHMLDVDSPDPLGDYVAAVARENQIVNCDASSAIPTGWCSWYHFYTHITAEDVRDNLKAAISLREQIPLGMIQLDDGFEAQVGDWFTFNKKFPDGVAPLAAEIRQADPHRPYTPGLWLAPFIVHPKSQLSAYHPEWLLCDESRHPVNAGFIWNTLTNALDLTHPEALQYACDVVQAAAHEWGYDFLKLDFLYAAALRGRYRDSTKTRAQVLRSGLEALRRAAGPHKILLGCGCPLGSALGLVDAMRIGPDVAPRWNPAYFNLEWPFRAETDMPSARNAIHNTLTRAPLHRRWWINDPDCLLLRPEARLTLAEVQTLASVIALTGGALLLSDDLPDLPPERLRIAAQLLPLIGQRPQVPDWFDHATPTRLRLDLENATGHWHLLAWFNWQDKKRDVTLTATEFGLPEGEYTAREFWRGEIYRGAWTLKEIPAHGVALLSVRPANAQYLGSDLHISQGLEVTQWSATPEGLRFRIERPGKAEGQVMLRLPNPPRSVTINGENASIEPAGDDSYRLLVNFYRTIEVQML